ncbi:hypothetical protein [Allopontixanthobacter sediminis]|uniref:hypothetical protein n=1 Tax=Allopontixanthobacter sediminis TaxID=1689985 RepID=UPI001926BD79|nr:hypothetical protein [Allopontixanthobacter sediminis]
MVNNTIRELQTMYNRSFFQTKLGQAATASILAMVAFVAMSGQMQMAPSFGSAHAATINCDVELA